MNTKYLLFSVSILLVLNCNNNDEINIQDYLNFNIPNNNIAQKHLLIFGNNLENVSEGLDIISKYGNKYDSINYLLKQKEIYLGLAPLRLQRFSDSKITFSQQGHGDYNLSITFLKDSIIFEETTNVFRTFKISNIWKIGKNIGDFTLLGIESTNIGKKHIRNCLKLIQTIENGTITYWINKKYNLVKILIETPPNYTIRIKSEFLVSDKELDNFDLLKSM